MIEQFKKILNGKFTGENNMVVFLQMFNRIFKILLEFNRFNIK